MNVIDTPSISRRFVSLGFSELHAKQFACELERAAAQDFWVTRQFMEVELGSLRGQVSAELRAEFKKLKLCVMMCLGGAIVACCGMLIAVTYFI